MRSFADDSGQVWDLVLGRESWGRIVALFLPRGGSAPVLEAALAAGGYQEAERELESMDPAGLRALLETALPKDLG